MIASKAAKIVRAKAEREATIIIDDVAAFNNNPQALREIATYAGTIIQEQNDQEYAIAPGITQAVWEQLTDAFQEKSLVNLDGSLVPSQRHDVGLAWSGIRKTSN